MIQIIESPPFECSMLLFAFICMLVQQSSITYVGCPGHAKSLVEN